MNVLDRILAHPTPETDREFFLDHRREHRLRRSAPGIAAVARRDGRTHHIAWPDDDPMPTGEAFAARIFNICEKAAATS
ncbi:hypothetical protein ACFO8O_10695 [Hephaestia sp. GCM10023244]|uniref:hypothetical protein n=1 Tax=unclassified Hephaestia TaxID=2631281 RepID=UPI0020771302|nr:hypothetical protein [Hephaestia sp. MAHUQ-44]MCM8731427.1 hypothetical protein [Hephaestia sp. MAHUQ-44]